MPVEQSRDPEQFTAFELSGWETNIGGYNAAFGAVARQGGGDDARCCLCDARHAGVGCVLRPRNVKYGGFGARRGSQWTRLLL